METRRVGETLDHEMWTLDQLSPQSHGTQTLHRGVHAGAQSALIRDTTWLACHDRLGPFGRRSDDSQ